VIGARERERERERVEIMSDPIIEVESGIRYVECFPFNDDKTKTVVPERWNERLRVVVVRLSLSFSSIFLFIFS